MLRGRFGRPYTFVDRCASTQRLLDGAREGAVVATDEQTEGRGRLGRTWHAPAGTSLLFSIVLEPAVPPERLPELSLVAGAAVAEAIAAQAGVATTVKHPNDVLVGGRKVAGHPRRGRRGPGRARRRRQRRRRRADELPPARPPRRRSRSKARTSIRPSCSRRSSSGSRRTTTAGSLPWVRERRRLVARRVARDEAERAARSRLSRAS